ncbi:hypothetical protein D8674_018801 [Pyrus ussuriensis x Pyrus communis]|uniref:Uncharacterized protein n=1 Tax=Pyrus ussuriensis x Pyrus communis TaxID=2448454 RepID=A0A5N5G5T9_9ROSA|nr:hypothetical protein D8674_018801 [Pyrus ussuriensis x Pyrus communis]
MQFHYTTRVKNGDGYLKSNLGAEGEHAVLTNLLTPRSTIWSLLKTGREYMHRSVMRVFGDGILVDFLA